MLESMGARKRFWIDVLLLAGMVVTCASGLVLLFAFHVGHGRLRSGSLGLPRLAWQDLHRLGAVCALAAAAAHAWANARPIGVRILRALRGAASRQHLAEVAFYALFAVVSLTGLAAWLLAGPPWLGPPGPVSARRHHLIDVHFLASFPALYLATRHVRRRWGALGALARRALAAQPARSPMPARRNQTAFIVIDTHPCKACARCVAACPVEVLGIVGFAWHHHVRIRRARAALCQGCRRCVRACAAGAIAPRLEQRTA
jgi:NAD-dependent dihydropyrimidine dehydrogenase PreA subunit